MRPSDRDRRVLVVNWICEQLCVLVCYGQTNNNRSDLTHDYDDVCERENVYAPSRSFEKVLQARSADILAAVLKQYSKLWLKQAIESIAEREPWTLSGVGRRKVFTGESRHSGSDNGQGSRLASGRWACQVDAISRRVHKLGRQVEVLIYFPSECRKLPLCDHCWRYCLA